MPKKILQKYSVFFLLLLFSTCADSKNSVQADPSDPEPVAAEAVEISPPEAFFTETDVLLNGNQSAEVIDRLIDLINAVPGEESIYISIYMFEYEPLLEALKRAHTRDVSLHLMMDMSDRSNNTVTAENLEQLDENVEIVRIQNNASASAINHNKFVLLPKVITNSGTVDNVIFQTSQNFTESGKRKIQDAVLLSNEDLYQEYLDYWQDMKRLAFKEMDDFEYREYEVPSGDIKAYFYPKRKDGISYGDDTIIEILEGIDNPSSSTVKIGMSAWTDSRLVIIEKLSELLSQDADLQVVTKSNIGDKTYNRLSELSEKGATIKIFNVYNTEETKINMHSKFMMIQGSWNGSESEILLTGTQNFTINALRKNNEVSLLFSNHKFFSQYEEYFDELKSLPGVCCYSES